MTASSKSLVGGLSLVNLLANIVRVALSFLMTILAARALGATSFGTYNVLIGYTFWLNYLIPLGYDLSLPYFVSLRGKGHLAANSRVLLKESLKTTFIFGLFVSALTILVLRQLLTSFGQTDLFPAAVLIVLQSLFWGLGSVLAGFLRAHKVFKPALVREQLLFPIANLVLFLISVRFLLMGINGLALAYFFASLASCIYVAIASFKLATNSHNSSISLTPGSSVNRVRYSLPLALMNVLENMTYFVSIVIIGTFCTPADVGFYSVSLRIAMLTQFFFIAIQPIAAPFLGELIANQKKDEFISLYQIISFWGAKWIIITGFIIASSADYILSLFGKEFQHGSNLLVFIIVAVFIEGLFGITKQALIMVGKSKINSYNQVISSMLNFIFCIFLVREIGPMGGAIAFIVGSISLSSFRYYQSLKILKSAPLSRKQGYQLLLLTGVCVSVYLLIAFFKLAGDVRLAIAFIGGAALAAFSFWGDRHHFTELILPRVKSRFSKHF